MIEVDALNKRDSSCTQQMRTTSCTRDATRLEFSSLLLGFCFVLVRYLSMSVFIEWIVLKLHILTLEMPEKKR